MCQAITATIQQTPYTMKPGLRKYDLRKIWRKQLYINHPPVLAKKVVLILLFTD